MSDKPELNGPVERAHRKFAKSEDIPDGVKAAISRLVDGYRRYYCAVGRELSPAEMREFMRQTLPPGIEKFLSLVNQEEILDQKEKGDAPPSITPAG